MDKIKKENLKRKHSIEVRDVIAVDLDQTIVDNPSFMYKIMNVGISSLKFVSAIRNVFQKHRAEVFNFNKVYKKSFMNGLFGMLNPNKFSEIKDAVKYINKLHENYDIFLVTSRPVDREFHRYLLASNIKNLGVKVDFVVANCADKAEVCKTLGVKFLIDNCLNYCVETNENSETQAIRFNDKHIGEYKSVLHLGDWSNIYDFIRYVDPLKKSIKQPYTTYGLQQEYRKHLERKIYNYQNGLCFVNYKKYDKENTK